MNADEYAASAAYTAQFSGVTAEEMAKEKAMTPFAGKFYRVTPAIIALIESRHGHSFFKLGEPIYIDDVDTGKQGERTVRIHRVDGGLMIGGIPIRLLQELE